MAMIAERLRQKLTDGLSPSELVIEDDSARHAGHGGARPGGESHFNVTIESAAFVGLNAVARQRLVYRLLAEELAGPVHALSLTLRPPAAG